jgi:2-oxoglutarate ferredoxin oxidoreductase subunit alpha
MQVAAWYPITPSSSIAEALIEYAPQLRKDGDKLTCAIVQAEDELAAIGMVVGAGWAGARAMTATSGPGISLMAEFVGLAYFAEVPGVIWDIQRMGPSTGLPTRTSQGDVLATYYLSHGDTRHVILFPATPKECFDMAGIAFDLTEHLQTPIFVLSDLDLGMNLWISDAFEYPEAPMDRGKVLDVEMLKGFSEKYGKSWGRYLDVDQDGIGWRTLPGTKHPLAAYFTRGTGHTAYATYTERSEEWENNLHRLARKFETARHLVPGPVVDEVEEAKIAIISYGSNDPAIQEARSRLRAAGVETSYMRLRALPINDVVSEFVASYDKVYVVENNYDGQVHTILSSELPRLASRLIATARCNGLPLSARWITEQILK